MFPSHAAKTPGSQATGAIFHSLSVLADCSVQPSIQGHHTHSCYWLQEFPQGAAFRSATSVVLLSLVPWSESKPLSQAGHFSRHPWWFLNVAQMLELRNPPGGRKICCGLCGQPLEESPHSILGVKDMAGTVHRAGLSERPRVLG